jgi:serine acetyltransferase
MSSPTSTKMAPPTYVDPKIRRRYVHIYLLQIWISLIPTAWFSYMLFAPDTVLYSLRELMSRFWIMPDLVYYMIIPFGLLFIYTITIVWAAIITKIRLMWLNLLHKPIEGVFHRSKKDKDYVYWNKRNLTRMFLYWLLHTLPFTYLKKYFSYVFFGMKIGKDSVVNHVWLSPEFVTIGNNVKIGQAACIYSFMFEADMLLVAHVEIEDDVLIGPQTVILPGTKIQKGVIIDAGAWSDPFFTYEENGVYHGTPVELIRKKTESDQQSDEKVDN